ncbi:MAG TPA: hypothetical protein ENK70_07185 [Methylophaga sp.]|nr:hypothetical protein [Methylophaga sp.]
MKKRSKKVSMLPPYLGLNSQDGSTGNKNEAIVLENFVIKNKGLELRLGKLKIGNVTGTPTGFLNYNVKLVNKLFLTTTDGLFDAQAATLSRTYAGGTISGTEFNGYLHYCNGVKPPERFNGSIFELPSWTFVGNEHPSPNDFNGVFAFNHRLYFWNSDTQDFCYSEVDAIQGKLSLFRLSLVGRFGGNLVAINSISMNSGDGLNDYLLFFMSSGEVIIYTGSDPSSATDWLIHGVYRIHAPFNQNSIIRLGGDLLVLANNDVVSMKRMIVEGITNIASNIANTINSISISAASTDNRWNLLLSESKGFTVVNVPIGTNDSKQLILNTSDNTISTFVGLNAWCWGERAGTLYFCDNPNGGTPALHKYEGNVDIDQRIKARVQMAYTDLGTPKLKQIAAVRVIIQYFDELTFRIGIGTDFDADIEMVVVDDAATLQPAWDVAEWDESGWYKSTGVVVDEWDVFGEIGQDLSLVLEIESNDYVRWSRVDLLVDVGSGL